MRTTTRKYLRTEDVYFDGISWGTPIGQIRFEWIDNDKKINIYHDEKLINTTDHPARARIIVNRMIGAFLK